MAKLFSCSLIVFMFLFVLIGCASNNQDISNQPVEDVPPAKGNDKVNQCTLIVNEEDISSGNYVKINHEEKYAEIPLLAIMKKLGAQAYWANEKTVVIEYKGESISIDTSDECFGIPVLPGANNAVRTIAGDELIMDSLSVQDLLKNMVGAKIDIDFDASTVYISNLDKK